MNPDPAKRQSRTGWPLRKADESVPEHDHRLPRALWGLVALVAALTVVVALLVLAIWQDRRYIAELREYRDLQMQQQEEIERLRLCRLMDTLPRGGLLERSRSEFGCEPGNGYDPAEIDPRQQQQQRDFTTPQTEPAPTPAPLVIPDGPRTLDTEDPP